MDPATARAARSSLAVFSRCASAGEPVYHRTFAWCKLALLAEAVARLPDDGWAVFVDSDVLLEHGPTPLAGQPQLKTWLSQSMKGGPALFAAREPRGEWPRGSVKDAPNHRNILNNTHISSGFLMARRHSVPMLSDWFCAANRRCDEVGGGIGCYRVDWPHDQGQLFDTMVHGHRIAVAYRPADYNTPEGRFAKHFWWKARAKPLAYVRGVARNLSVSLRSRGSSVSKWRGRQLPLSRALM